MRTNFYLPPNRLPELKEFMAANLPSAKFAHAPYQEVGGHNKNKFFITIELTVKENAKLGSLHQKWHDEDNPSEKCEGFFKRIFNFFNCF